MSPLHINDPGEYEFQHDNVEPPRERPLRSIGWWIVAMLVTVGAAAGIYITFGKRMVQPPPPPQPTVRAPAARPLGGQPEPIALPSLDESDTLVRTLVRALSNHPVVAAWLATDDLVRSFTVAVSNIAEDASPAKRLAALRPHTDFRVVETQGKFYIDPRSYERYGPVADAVASVDAGAAATLYATLKPRIADAAGELGLPAERFDQVLEAAIVKLLRTPTPDGPVQVTSNVNGIGYAFADGRLEQLSAGQKALLRMGPRNARIIKARLREIALALGVPPARLPAD
jgi:Protein of unknown function (DUF3014)